MRRLEERTHKTIYYFRSKSGKRLNKYSGDNVSESEISQFEIPEFLLEKNKEKQQ